MTHRQSQLSKSDAVVLVVDDQPAVLDFITQTLKRADYQVLSAGNGTEALAVLGAQPVDLIIADVRMPTMNGYQLYERVIQNPEWVATPFILLTSCSLDSEVRYGKELGVDDYLTKPIRPEDLLAAVRGRLRRVQQLASSSPLPPARPTVGSDVLHLGALRIDSGQHRAWLNGQPAKLSAREFRLLDCLAHQANKVVPLQALIRATHGLKTDPTDAGALLRPLIRSLRRKLGYPAGDMGCIESVRSVGYRLIPPCDG